MLDEENFYPDDDRDLLDGDDDLNGDLPEDLTEGVPDALEPDGDLEEGAPVKDLPTGQAGLPLSRPLPQEDGLTKALDEDET